MGMSIGEKRARARGTRSVVADNIGNRFSRNRPTGLTCPGRSVNTDASLRSRTFICYTDRLIYLHTAVRVRRFSLLTAGDPAGKPGPACSLENQPKRAREPLPLVVRGAFSSFLLLFPSSPIIDAPRASLCATRISVGRNILRASLRRDKKRRRE